MPSEAYGKIVKVLAKVPRGCVATYGQVARLAGFPGHARQVVWALHSSSKKRKLPWHRIINSQGRIGLPEGRGRSKQKALLVREGIEVDAYGRVDLKKYGWYPKGMAIEQKVNAFFGDTDPGGFGTGWWSGVLSAFFGILAFGGVLCLHFPQLLSSPGLRPHYDLASIRLLIQAVIVGAIITGVLSAILRKKKILAFTGMVFALLACLLGGSSVPINQPLHSGPAIGLDWFLLDMLITTLIFSPIEVLWPAYPEQGVFRNEWMLDLGYFVSTHLPIQITEFLVLLPATEAVKFLPVMGVKAAIEALPWVVQFFLAVLVADLAEYWIHRALHQVPWLWRFHAIHHSCKSLDWIAGSRSHLVDDLIIRGGMLVPMALLFSQGMIVAYLIFVTVHATWTHANFGPTAFWAEELLVQPRYHHWHHTSQKEAIDKNFAIHFPWIDRIFGTYYLPKDKGWPKAYGIEGEQPPPNFFKQFVWPFAG